MKYRPWGPIDWALALSTRKQWHFVGTIGTEERSICSWRHLTHQNLVANRQFALIEDVDSEKYGERTRTALAARLAEFLHHGGNEDLIARMPVMSELFRVIGFVQDAAASESVVLDITSFPKRFFFPILRKLAGSSQVKNLLLTYTSPASYAPEGQPLYEDIEPWGVLPGFGGAQTTNEQWVVSMGFLVESLCRYVGDNPETKMKLLIPFPAPLSALRRTWESVANLEHGRDGRFEKFRVETLDMSAAFDRIRSIAGMPEKSLAFAPFGPKPISAAMCLYSMQRGSSVHYPQPTLYHPEYSRGILKNNPSEAISAYWVKHAGENLYVI